MTIQIGPNGEKRPNDPIARAVMVAKISTGEMEEQYVDEDQGEELPTQPDHPSGSNDRREAEATTTSG